MWRPEHAEECPEPAARPSQLLAAARRALARSAGDVARAIVDLAMPPCCPGCGARLGAAGGLCIDCWSTLRPIEEPWCERLGVPFAYDLGPGTLSGEAVADPPVYGRARAAVAYEGIAPALVHAFKYADRTELADVLAAQMVRAGRELLAGCDLVVPVPLNPRRLFARRFNQAALIAGAIGRRTGVAVDVHVLTRPKPTRQQVGLTRQGRMDNVRGAFAVAPARADRIAGRHVLLVDDVYTTGATLSAAARVLRRAGAREVDVLTFARVVAMP